MRKDGYYSSGQFAAKANVTVRTIRFYDRHNILKPSFVNEKGARFYTDQDFAKLQQILLLKYLGFSLEEIRQLTIGETDRGYLRNSLALQQRLVEDKIEQLQLVRQAISDTASLLGQDREIDWSRMLELIHLTGMEQSLAAQYRGAANLSARIRLHALYSSNREGWFPWIYRQCGIQSGMRILELGCGSGALWSENLSRLPKEVSVTLSDLSDGMIRDARRALGTQDPRFSFLVFDAHRIPFPDQQFDLVIANHVLFYCHDIPQVCREVRRVLNPGGLFVCSAYGAGHMAEITRLVQEFDARIVLSAEKLYEQFGLENGAGLLSEAFSEVTLRRYEDSLLVDRPEPLAEYILSCHGNQNQYLLDRYQEFRAFLQRRSQGGFSVTKEAGIFLCRP